MKNNYPLPFAAIILSIFLTACGDLKEPELIGIEKVKVDRVSIRESGITLQLHYFNPNNYRLKLKSAEGDAWLDDTLLGHFTVDTFIHILPKSDFYLPVKLKMDMKNMIGNMTKAFSGKPVTVKIEGIAKAGKSVIYKDYPIRYEGKQNLEDFLK